MGFTHTQEPKQAVVDALFELVTGRITGVGGKEFALNGDAVSDLSFVLPSLLRSL